MDTIPYSNLVTEHWSVVVITLTAICSVVGTIYLTVRLLNRRDVKHRDMTWLEITPPASIAKTPAATEHLFSVIHGSRAARRSKDKLLGRLPVMSFEIASTKQDGIRYLVQVEASKAKSVQKSITSYIPDSKVKEVDPPEHKPGSVIEFTQAKHYVFPIMTISPAEQHDPMSYITGAMTKLEDDEQITMQLVLTPVNLPEARQLSKRILGNEDVLRRVQRGNVSFMSRLFEGLGGLAMGTAELIGEFYSGTTHGYQQNKSNGKDAQFQSQVMKRQRPARTLSAFELELMESMHQKLTKPLFLVNLRVMVAGSSPSDHIASLRSALNAYSVPPYQELRAKARLPVINTYRARLAEKRLPSLSRKQGLILSVAEVASLYHFPSTLVSKTDNLVASLSRTLPAPISLKQNKQFDVLLGQNEHHNTVTPIGLTDSERARHVYIIGGTGNGKTTLLQYAIVQDIRNGKGVAVVDPHGDLAETILRHVPEHRLKDVVYFNPDDLAHPIGLNILELPDGLTDDELLREKDLITESTVSVFRKIFSEDDSGGHRVEYVLRNAVQTALTQPGATLFTVYDLINDPTYRRKVVASLEDENLKNFWRNEFGKAGGFQQVKMVAGITAKIGRFLFSASAKRILEQPRSTINFDEIMNEGKILICNFSKGLLGEDTSELFGVTVLAKLQLASLRRARIKQSNRQPYYLYVDEFQNFATPSFVQMLSESRKYKLYLLMAEQSTSQQDDQNMVNVILANVGTVVCFRTGNPADEQALLPIFIPYIERGEIANLPAFNYYVRISAIASQEPLSGQTVLLEDDGSDEMYDRIVEYSRKTYATVYKQPEKPTSKPVEITRKNTVKKTSTSAKKKSVATVNLPNK